MSSFITLLDLLTLILNTPNMDGSGGESLPTYSHSECVPILQVTTGVFVHEQHGRISI